MGFGFGLGIVVEPGCVWFIWGSRFSVLGFRSYSAGRQCTYQRESCGSGTGVEFSTCIAELLCLAFERIKFSFIPCLSGELRVSMPTFGSTLGRRCPERDGCHGGRRQQGLLELSF